MAGTRDYVCCKQQSLGAGESGNPNPSEPRQFYYQCHMTDAGQLEDLVFDLVTSVQSCASILPCWNVLVMYYHYMLYIHVRTTLPFYSIRDYLQFQIRHGLLKCWSY